MNAKYIKRLLANRPDIKAKHGTPVTRRELFAQGYLSAGAFAVMPSLLSLAEKKAYGQANSCKAEGSDNAKMIPFIVVDLAGGAGIPGRNVMVGGPGGQEDYLPVNGSVNSYGTIGLAPEAGPEAAGISMMRDFGLAFHPQSRIYQGMLAATSEATRANVDGVVYATSSGDDTGNNPHNPVYWVAKAGANGDVVSIVGTEDTESGGRASVPEGSIDAAKRPVRVGSAQDAVGLVLPGLLDTLGGTEFARRIMDQTKTMSAARIAAFNSLSVNEQAKKVLNCAYSEAERQATGFDSSLIDPAQDIAITTAFPNFGNNGEQTRAGTIAKLVLDGYAGSGTVRLGGYDYHANGLPNIDQDDLRAGDIIGRLLEAAALKGQDLMIYVITDGGVAARTEANNLEVATGRFAPTSDSGQRSAAISFVYKASGGRPEILDGLRQLGAYKSSGGVDNDFGPWSNSPEVLAKLVVAQFLAMHGREGELEQVVGNHPFLDLSSLLSYGKIRS